MFANAPRQVLSQLFLTWGSQLLEYPFLLVHVSGSSVRKTGWYAIPYPFPLCFR